MPAARLETTSLPGQVIPSNTNIVAQYDSGTSTISDYINIGTVPYDEMTVLNGCTLLITAGVTWTNSVADCIRNMYIQYQKNNTSTWVPIVGNSTRCGPGELATAWRTGNVALAYRMYQGDKFRVTYYASSGVTLAYVNALTTGRVRPYLAMAVI